jgi:glycosyltransferase involved in cell wall biosynthesis
MKIVIVGPGLMELPPKNWGAVESLIWDYSEYLKEKNVIIDIINNPNMCDVATCVNNLDYDFVHVQYDDHAAMLSQILKKPFCVTNHYGLIKEHYPYYSGWRHIFNGALNSPGLICLSEEIKQLFVHSGYNKFIRVLRNGARFKDFVRCAEGNGKSICLGKIESRKNQSRLVRECNNSVCVDFIGPIVDTTFAPTATCQYLGVWNKQTLYNNLSHYSSLVLLSNGEAAPLVVPEALCAGLSLVITETAAANLDRSLPFIHVLPNNYTSEHAINSIKEANENNMKYRNDIVAYAKQKFDWAVIVDEYLSIIEEFRHENCIS